MIWLIDFDGSMENLALMRLSTYYKRQGSAVVLKQLGKSHRAIDFESACPPLFDRPEKVYISCLFRWNKGKAEMLAEQWNGNAILGGTGIDYNIELDDNVASCLPDPSLYETNKAVGFISRGCPNRCPWCVVWRKEGKLNRVNTAESIIENFPDAEQAIFLDNNFLALEDYQKDLEWLAKNGIPIDFNQGLDAKYVTPESARLLSRCNWVNGPRLALDHDSRIDVVKRAVKYLNEAGIHSGKITLFILIGFSGIYSDIARLLIARELGVNAFPMGFRDLDTGDEPARGWNRSLYKKYRRLIIRLPQATKVWEDFKREIITDELIAAGGIVI